MFGRFFLVYPVEKLICGLIVVVRSCLDGCIFLKPFKVLFDGRER